MFHRLKPSALPLLGSIAIGLAVVNSSAQDAPSRPRQVTGVDPQLSDRVTSELLVRVALERNPGLRAGRSRAEAMLRMGEAERKLPPPEAEFQMWQVPLSRPYDVGDSQMIMLGVKQPIPAPGSLDARAEVREREADLESAMVSERARDITRDVQHAFVDYVEAENKHREHLEHKAAADRVLAVARARYASGGAITDAAQAELEVARIEVDIAQERARIDSARSRINGLLLRDPAAPLGPPEADEPRSVAQSDAELMLKAQGSRPEPKTARARTAQRFAESRASEREASWPTFSVGASYFAPTHLMPVHGFGLSVSSTLPWLWGRARAEATANRGLAGASEDDVRDAESRVRAEVATSAASVRAAARRFQVLRDRALPAGRRAWEAAATGYESGKTDILMLLTARKAMVEIEVGIVEARSALEHALVDLQWATGGHVRTAPIATVP
jgi:outer membrane protein, heavy metal efflux system